MRIRGNTVHMSSNETHDWGKLWPCSTVAGKSVAVEMSPLGHIDTRVNGRQPRYWGEGGDIDPVELGKIEDDMIAYYEKRQRIKGERAERRVSGK